MPKTRLGRYTKGGSKKRGTRGTPHARRKKKVKAADGTWSNPTRTKTATTKEATALERDARAAEATAARRERGGGGKGKGGTGTAVRAAPQRYASQFAPSAYAAAIPKRRGYAWQKKMLVAGDLAVLYNQPLHRSWPPRGPTKTRVVAGYFLNERDRRPATGTGKGAKRTRRGPKDLGTKAGAAPAFACVGSLGAGVDATTTLAKWANTARKLFRFRAQLCMSGCSFVGLRLLVLLHRPSGCSATASRARSTRASSTRPAETCATTATRRRGAP